MDILTKEDCLYILNQLHESPELISYEINPAHKSLDGFFGDSFILTTTSSVKSTELVDTFFLKRFPESPENAEMARNLLAYEKETFFYDKIVKDLSKRGYDTSFAPKCLLCKGGAVIVMENLVEQDFKTHFVFDLEQCKSSLKTVAELHGASIRFEEEMSKELGKEYRLGEEFEDVLEERFFDMQNQNSFVSKHFNVSLDCIEKLLGYMPQDKALKVEFMKRLRLQDFDKIFYTELPHRKVLCHGDLWRRNIMFQAKTNACRLVDFQMIRYFHPSFDVLSLLYFNLPRKLYHQKQPLLQFYYACLSSSVDNLSAILSWEEFMATVRHFEFLAAYQAAAGHTLDITGNVTDCFFGSRAEHACLEFEKNEDYRNVMVDDITTLIDCLMSD